MIVVARGIRDAVVQWQCIDLTQIIKLSSILISTRSRSFECYQGMRVVRLENVSQRQIDAVDWSRVALERLLAASLIYLKYRRADHASLPYYGDTHRLVFGNERSFLDQGWRRFSSRRQPRSRLGHQELLHPQRRTRGFRAQGIIRGVSPPRFVQRHAHDGLHLVPGRLVAAPVLAMASTLTSASRKRSV
jgi:hypothetical protein